MKWSRLTAILFLFGFQMVRSIAIDIYGSDHSKTEPFQVRTKNAWISNVFGI